MSVKKLKNKRGETLIETLMAILVAVLAFAALSTAVLAAGKINAKVKSTDISFQYTGSTQTEGQVTLTGRQYRESGMVELYENSGYYYYFAGGTTP